MDSNFHPMHLERAREITGGLSYPSKMPGPAWGIPAEYCENGAKFSLLPGSVCRICYGKRGPIAWPAARNKQEQRLRGLEHPQWVEAMTVIINFYTEKYFRWFDVGDLQGKEHLDKIIQIANNLPHIIFWLPTQEHALIRGRTFPPNLTVRVTATMIDGTPKGKGNLAVVRKLRDYPDGYLCPSKQQENKCGPCRECWDKHRKLIVYQKH